MNDTRSRSKEYGPDTYTARRVRDGSHTAPKRYKMGYDGVARSPYRTEKKALRDEYGAHSGRQWVKLRKRLSREDRA